MTFLSCAALYGNKLSMKTLIDPQGHLYNIDLNFQAEEKKKV